LTFASIADHAPRVSDDDTAGTLGALLNRAWQAAHRHPPVELRPRTAATSGYDLVSEAQVGGGLAVQAGGSAVVREGD
jgi:hypothetical protein